MKRAVRRAAATAAVGLALALTGVGAASAAPQPSAQTQSSNPSGSGGDYVQAHADVSAGRAYVVGMSESGGRATWQIGYDIGGGWLSVETFNAASGGGSWEYVGKQNWHSENQDVPNNFGG